MEAGEEGLDVAEQGEAGIARPLRVCTINLAHGCGLRLHPAFLSRARIKAHLAAVAAVVRRERPDVVALQEADGPCLWSGGFDHVRHLAELVGHRWSLHGHHARLVGRAPRLRYGTALLAGRPLSGGHVHAFERARPIPPKGFVVAGIELHDGRRRQVDIASLHLDPARPQVRMRQARELIAVLERRGRPVVLMGDFNSEDMGPGGPFRLLAEELDLHPHRPAGEEGLATFPSWRPRQRLDWILASTGLRLANYRVLDDLVSDHRPVIADVMDDPPA